MSKEIFEEKGGPHRGHAAGATDLEKQASQLASDVKYKVKKGMSGATNLNPAQVAKAYLAQLAKSPAPAAVKTLAKKKIMGEEYTSDINELVKESVTTVLTKVFVDGVPQKVEEELVQIDEMDEKKYFIVVTDKKTGNKYRRKATRSKIAELRSNPNISSVEITGYGKEDAEEKKGGKKTASVKSGKGLDPVGKEDGDVDNDGDRDKSDKYLLKRRKAIGKSIATRTEEFLGELNQEKKSKKTQSETVDKKFDIKNGISNKVTVFPDSLPMKEEVGTPQKPEKDIVDPNERRQISTLQQFQRKQQQLSQQKLAAQKSGRIPVGSVQMDSYEAEGENVQEVAPPGAKYERMVKHIKAGYADGGLTKKEKSIAYATAWKAKNKAMKEEACDCEDEKEPKLKKSEGGVEDPREIPTKVTLVKNKLRAMGLKMSYEPEGEVIDERRKEDKVAGTPRKPRDRALEIVSKAMGSGRMGVQPRGQKKVPGKKPPAAGEHGASRSPAQKVAMRRAAAQRSQDMMHSPRD